MIKLELQEIELSSEVARPLGDEEQIIASKMPSIKKPLVPLTDKHNLTEEDYHRIVEMAWQDRTHFDVIERQYGLGENEIKKIMRKLISAKAYKRWRRRVQGRKTKHKQRCTHKPTRFQGPW
jgi:uncharacterized protein (TIGR03643 family)